MTLFDLQTYHTHVLPIEKAICHTDLVFLGTLHYQMTFQNQTKYFMHILKNSVISVKATHLVPIGYNKTVYLKNAHMLIKDNVNLELKEIYQQPLTA